MVFPSQYMSSASLATKPSSSRSPSTRHNSSSSAVSDPGIPIAERGTKHSSYFETTKSRLAECEFVQLV